MFSRSRSFAIGLALTSLILIGCASTQNVGPVASENIAEARAVLTSDITVFRSPTCGCCGEWIEHIESAGFQVTDEITEDMTAVKQQYGVPENMASCHTAIVGSYIIEGHVPAEDVQRLLIEKPNVVGIAVPGMPVGSPGMESGSQIDPYTIFSFTKSGETAAFAEHS